MYSQTKQTQLASRSALKIWLTTTRATDPRHVDLRACIRLLPVVYLHVLRTCALDMSCTSSTEHACMAKVRDKRCSQSGVLGARSRASYQIRWSATPSKLEASLAYVSINFVAGLRVDLPYMYMTLYVHGNEHLHPLPGFHAHNQGVVKHVYRYNVFYDSLLTIHAVCRSFAPGLLF